MWGRDNVEKWKLADWDDPSSPKAPLSKSQIDTIEEMGRLLLVTDSQTKEEKHEKTVNPSGSVFEFLEICSALECEVLGETNKPHESLIAQLEVWLEETNAVLASVDTSVQALEKLKEQHSTVAESTGALHASCRALAAQESKLQELGEQITSRLEPLTGLEALTERLSNPSLMLSGGSFYLALSRLDQALQYIEQHPEYKEASQFRAQAKFALSRAISAMHEAVRSSFEQAAQQVLALPTQTDLSGGAGLALCVGRFQAAASRARNVLKQIESRIDVTPEYSRLLSDCRDLYVQQRRALLSNSVSAAIQELVVRHRGDHCSLLRAACSFALHVSLDEYHLYLHFFAQPSRQLSEYLDGLCGCLYDILRPIIIHVNHLETLAELCTILRFELLEEQIPNNPEALESLQRTLHQLLQDVQERLVFRAHVHLQSDILDYNPSPGDLAYPDKLLMMESIASLVMEENQAAVRRVSVTSRASVADSEVSMNSTATRTHSSPADLHGMWYPPVRRVLATLSRLYRCVDRSIFQGLSQEALAACVRSVAKAASMIAVRSTQVDASLFEMKHLLILREQVSPFHVDFSVQETSLDFTRVKAGLYTLYQKRSQLFSLNNNSLLEFLLEGTPTVKQLTVDSRKEVDRQLKSVCEAFIDHATVLLTPTISALIARVENHRAESGPLKQQPWFAVDRISEAVTETQRQTKTQLPLLIKSLQLYLACQETEMLLYRHIKARVLSVFQALEKTLESCEFTEEQKMVIALPTPEQVQLLLSTASQAPPPSNSVLQPPVPVLATLPPTTASPTDAAATATTAAATTNAS